ncbi:hypothetical protein TRFO_37792 [Tritrichomonas foetus]|uniref:SKP1 component dimerisation domain-containing protein n=1 Tax=Tritrichomonas foetus TaxID=1144522 RepID=A0A1J4JBQ7_9EUKA|nr:hypothetical protein TRFO_37792 [Tritrichomonas foetus]|eukprot:OHS96089.1 hypothetical protein TRFO_37792 [Tritrichomonas foetus]
MIYDLENVEPKIKIPKLNQEIVGYIFNYIGRYYVRDAKSKKNSDYEWAKSFFNEAANKPFLDNFGNILMASQFLQVEILTSMMERYIHDTISACKTAEEVGKALSLELEGSVPERLQWTERLEK